MKKIKTLFLITFFFSLLSTNINAEKSNKVGINKVISGEVCYRSKRNCYPLEKGKYIIFAKEGTHDYFGYDLFESARVENNQILATFDFFVFNGNGKRPGLVSSHFRKEFFGKPNQGLYEGEPKMHYLKKFLKGQTLHGFGVQVVDAKKELNYPDDINDKVYSAKFRAFIRENNLNYAPIFLCSTNLYYSNLVKDDLVGYSECIDPVAFGGPESKFPTERETEYHPNNINKHPKHKKFVDEYLSRMALKHKKLEEIWKVKKHHELDLIDIIISTETKKNKTKVPDQLKKLKDLYKDGVITGYEYEKAKKKILN